MQINRAKVDSVSLPALLDFPDQRYKFYSTAFNEPCSCVKSGNKKPDFVVSVDIENLVIIYHLLKSHQLKWDFLLATIIQTQLKGK